MFRPHRDITGLTDRLIELERQISDLRLQQAVVVNELDRARVHALDGARSMQEWITSRADVTADTARSLLFAARTVGTHRHVNRRMIDGGITFDRALATLAFLETGASRHDAEASYELGLADVRRRTAARRRLGRRDERSLHAGRYFTAQPTLDGSRYRLWGELPGYEGRVVEKAIAERGDELRRQSPDVPSTHGQRSADALVAMSQDSLERNAATGGEPTAGSDGASVTVFVDAREEDAPETAAEVGYGPRVGPDTLETLLCTGSVRVVGMHGARPVSTSRTSRTIPPAIRAVVAHRDKRCAIDGCTSRYRLQPHHVQGYATGGDHDPDNLVTLCWYHHHVAVHRSGFRIDPESPPRRRRLMRPTSLQPGRSGADPP